MNRFFFVAFVSALILLTVAWIINHNNRFERDVLLIQGTGIWHDAMAIEDPSITEPSPNNDFNGVVMVMRLFENQEELSTFTRFCDDHELWNSDGLPYYTVDRTNDDYTPERMAATILNYLDCETPGDYFKIFSRMKLDNIFAEFCPGGDSHQEFHSFLQRVTFRSELPSLETAG